MTPRCASRPCSSAEQSWRVLSAGSGVRVPPGPPRGAHAMHAYWRAGWRSVIKVRILVAPLTWGHPRRHGAPSLHMRGVPVPHTCPPASLTQRAGGSRLSAMNTPAAVHMPAGSGCYLSAAGGPEEHRLSRLTGQGNRAVPSPAPAETGDPGWHPVSCHACQPACASGPDGDRLSPDSQSGAIALRSPGTMPAGSQLHRGS